MAWDFRPGMRVVCIKAIESRPVEGEIMPTVGAVYTIREVEPALPHSIGKSPLYLRFEEIRNPTLRYEGLPREVAFGCTRFRPLNEARIDCLRAHLAPRPRVEKVA